ncbi:hypothetical protein SK128_023320 [Halocaridina rubra]|uniref:Uncharacterized protein n=1 Tax=Halocaridina rubra TaxID=373956 RepID=A0AAN8WI00_HALRR
MYKEDLGAVWRRAVWKVAAVHTIISVTRYWRQTHPLPSPQHPTATPRTQVSQIKEQPSPRGTPIPCLKLDAQELPGCRGLDGYLNLGEVVTTLANLYKLSLLGVTYGDTEVWHDVIVSLPEEVGVVSKEAAVSIVSGHIATYLPNVHAITQRIISWSLPNWSQICKPGWAEAPSDS